MVRKRVHGPTVYGSMEGRIDTFTYGVSRFNELLDQFGTRIPATGHKNRGIVVLSVFHLIFLSRIRAAGLPLDPAFTGCKIAE
jgi:hypothetical protein